MSHVRWSAQVPRVAQSSFLSLILWETMVVGSTGTNCVRVVVLNLFSFSERLLIPVVALACSSTVRGTWSCHFSFGGGLWAYKIHKLSLVASLTSEELLPSQLALLQLQLLCRRSSSLPCCLASERLPSCASLLVLRQAEACVGVHTNDLLRIRARSTSWTCICSSTWLELASTLTACRSPSEPSLVSWLRFLLAVANRPGVACITDVAKTCWTMWDDSGYIVQAFRCVKLRTEHLSTPLMVSSSFK